jgi:hypothetical protein
VQTLEGEAGVSIVAHDPIVVEEEITIYYLGKQEAFASHANITLNAPLCEYSKVRQLAHEPKLCVP